MLAPSPKGWSRTTIRHTLGRSLYVGRSVYGVMQKRDEWGEIHHTRRADGDAAVVTTEVP